MPSGEASQPRQKIDHYLRALLALVFLQKMAGPGYGHVRLALCARNQFLENFLPTAGYWISIAECGEEWLAPAAQYFPGLAIDWSRRIVGLGRHEQRKRARARLVALV